MDQLTDYRRIVKDVLLRYRDIRYSNGEITNEPIFDLETDRFCVMSIGWQGPRRIHGSLIHLDIIGDKVWVQRDGTEYGIANELVEEGIPKDHIVLGFHSIDARPLTGFAVG